MEESEEDLKNFLMRVKEESEKNSLKLNIKKNNNTQKTKIMASGPISLWQKDGSSNRVPLLKSLWMATHKIR